MILNIRTNSFSNYQTNFLIWGRNDIAQSKGEKIKFWAAVSCKKKWCGCTKYFGLKQKKSLKRKYIKD